MAIELICITCRKRLRVPDGAAGRTARCPACGASVKVPARSRAIVQMDPAARVAEKPPWFDESGWAPVEQVTFGQVWKHAVSAWKQRLGGLVAATIAVLVLAVPIQAGIAVGLAAAQRAVADSSRSSGGGNAVVMQIGILLIGMLVAQIVAAGIVAAWTISWLDAARGKPVRLGRLIDARHCILPVLGFTLWFSLMCYLGMILFIVPGILYATTRWPALYFIVDKNQGVFDALSNAKRVTKGNMLLAFVVPLVGGLLVEAGALLVGIGIFFLWPLAGTLLASTYLYMAGQFKKDEVLDPYAERARRAKQKKEEPEPTPDIDDYPEFA